MRATILRRAGLVAMTLILGACSSAPPYHATAKSAAKTANPSSAVGTRTVEEGALSEVYRGLLGIPYRYGGSTRAGFDCSGLVGYVYRAYDGRQLPRNVADLYRTGHNVETSSLQAGDLVFFNTMGHGASHVGIYLGNRRFLHSSSSRGVIITHMAEDYYKRRYVGARRVGS